MPRSGLLLYRAAVGREGAAPRTVLPAGALQLGQKTCLWWRPLQGLISGVIRTHSSGTWGAAELCVLWGSAHAAQGCSCLRPVDRCPASAAFVGTAFRGNSPLRGVWFGGRS